MGPTISIDIQITDPVLRNAILAFCVENGASLGCVVKERSVSRSDRSPLRIVDVKGNASVGSATDDSQSDETTILICNPRSTTTQDLTTYDGWLYEDEVSTRTLLPWMMLHLLKMEHGKQEQVSTPIGDATMVHQLSMPISEIAAQLLNRGINPQLHEQILQNLEELERLSST